MKRKITIKPEEQDRILLNNEDSCTGYWAEHLIDFGFLPFPESYLVIERFASMGDPLCGKIRDMFESSSLNYGTKKFVIDGGDIAEKLLTRKMTESEYNDYLNGRKPIGVYDGKAFFLLKSLEAAA